MQQTSTTAPPGRPDWRSEVVGASGLNLLAAIWLIISPWVLNFHSGDSYWNPVLCGIIVGVFALARMGGAFRESGLSWLNALVGIWLFIAGFWLADSNQAQWNDWIFGAIVFVLGLVSAAATEQGTGVAAPRRDAGARGTQARPPRGQAPQS